MTTQGQMSKAVTQSIKDATLLPRDDAAVQLIRRYALLLDEARGAEDEAKTVADLGPKLLAALSALGMTLAGRGDKTKEVTGDSRPGPAALDELRARRATRQDRAKVVDASAT